MRTNALRLSSVSLLLVLLCAMPALAATPSQPAFSNLDVQYNPGTVTMWNEQTQSEQQVPTTTATITDTDTGEQIDVTSLPTCREERMLSGAGTVDLDMNSLSPRVFSASAPVTHNIHFVDGTEPAPTEALVVKPDWKLVFPLVGIAVREHIPLLIDTQAPARHIATQNFLEDLQITTVTAITSEADVRAFLQKHYAGQQVTAYATASDYYYAMYASWYAANPDMGNMPFLPPGMDDLFPGARKVVVDGLDDVAVIEKSYADSHPDPVTLVLTDAFTTTGSTDIPKDYNSMLAPYYAAYRKAFLLPIEHYSATGDTEKCAIVSAQVAYKVDGTRYFGTNRVLEENPRSLQALGMNVNSIDPGQGYLLILASIDSIPRELNAPWLGTSGWEYASCDYDIARSRLDAAKYDVVWNYGRIATDRGNNYQNIARSSALMNRAFYYDRVISLHGQNALFTQQIEYPPYSWSNGAFYRSKHVENSYALYQSYANALGIVDPAAGPDVIMGSIETSVQDKTLWISHAHGGVLPVYDINTRGKSTIIIDEGCLSVNQLEPRMFDWIAAFIGTTVETTGWDDYDITGITLGQYVASLPITTRSIMILYGDPLLKASWKDGPDDQLFKVNVAMRGNTNGVQARTVKEYRLTYPDTMGDEFDPVTGKITTSRNAYAWPIDEISSPEFFPIKKFKHTTATPEEQLDQRWAFICDVPKTQLISLAQPMGTVTNVFGLADCTGGDAEYCILAQPSDVVGQHTIVTYQGSTFALRGSNVDTHDALEGTYSVSLLDYCIYINNMNFFCRTTLPECLGAQRTYAGEAH